MPTPPPTDYFVADCFSLKAIAETTSNQLKAEAIGMLEQGGIRVPTAVWHEFCDMFPEQAEALGEHVQDRIRAKNTYDIAAAALADAHPGMLDFGPYETFTDWTAAAIASEEGAVLLTSSQRMGFYASLNACECRDVSSLV